ncbi:hypothetical protein FH972_025019 [Carpinus fangiana]|uniref:dual-specificity kinase n=1 Tax=Carpinus fangiana TaxID=176857 RepID=A0A5N6KZT7_9ROSI|nr:hypothetical protein FH972_025019 [Carpinus fangiana]
MSSSKRLERKADWSEFYKNGVPKEIICIDITPEAEEPKPSRSNNKSTAMPIMKTDANGGHVDKRRRVDGSKAYSYHEPTNPSTRTPYYEDNETASHHTSSSARTTSALTYSTATTSLGSQSSGERQRLQKLDDSRVGEKRKRPTRSDPRDDSELEVVAQHHLWSNYVPPPKPPIKAQDVYVQVVHDRGSSSSNAKYDDDDGHYIVQPDVFLTNRYKIIRLLGQGTFGKVVEAKDLNKGTKVAIKIIRAVQKYRDASRIELRVLSTLASNDRGNRNKCIHLRDCFDFRNHICIVTDLLGQSVFDFLKANSFVPFPSTHIQSFARQLFTSVAFLHDLNLIHTDLKPENILLVTSAYQTFTYNRTIPSSSRGTSRNAKFRKVLLDPEIRLIDFGSATFDDEYHSSVVSTRHYRAPEIILNLGWSFPCDIWSIGCILVEFFTGDALFQTHDNLEHLAMMEAVCDSKIDQDTIAKVRGRGKNAGKNNAASYFLPRAFRLDYPNSETPRTSKKYVKNMKRLEDIIPPINSFNKSFLDLLYQIFVYKPELRITAKEALNHPWFKETLQDDGTEALKIRLEREAKAHGHR